MRNVIKHLFLNDIFYFGILWFASNKAESLVEALYFPLATQFMQVLESLFFTIIYIIIIYRSNKTFT
jgi:hypothetical protein